MRLTHIEAAVIAAGPDFAAAHRIRDALTACVERVVLRESAHSIEAVCAALEDCKASALLVASDELGDLEPRAALALIAGMPARGGPQLVAFERGGKPDLRLALYRADMSQDLRAHPDLVGGLAAPGQIILVPGDWL